MHSYPQIQVTVTYVWYYIIIYSQIFTFDIMRPIIINLCYLVYLTLLSYLYSKDIQSNLLFVCYHYSSSNFAIFSMLIPSIIIRMVNWCVLKLQICPKSMFKWSFYILYLCISKSWNIWEFNYILEELHTLKFRQRYKNCCSGGQCGPCASCCFPL